MRVLLVIDSLGWGGAQRQIVTLAAGLAKRGHELALFRYQPEDDHFESAARAAGIELLAYSKRWKLDVGLIRALRRSIDRLRPDAIVSFLPTPTAYAVTAATLAGGVPVIASERGAFDAPVSAASQALRRQPLRLAAHVTTNSHHQAERLRRDLPCLAGRLSTIWNGVDTASFRPGERLRRLDDPLRLVAVGTVKPIKKAELLAQALVQDARRPGAPANVIWIGKILDPALRGRVDALLAAHGIGDRWSWLDLRDDVAERMRDADVLVHPNETEGLPNVLCEALASGLPAIAPRAADHERLLGEAERGLLFAPRDAADLAAAIGRFASLAPEAQARMRASARAFAERWLSLDSLAGQYETLLERVARARTGARRARS